MSENHNTEDRLVAWRDNPHRRNVIVTTTDMIPNEYIAEILGVVRGNTVRAKHIGKDIVAGLDGIIGGEIKAYTELLTEARDEAYNRMIRHAAQLQADAIVNVRFVTSMIAPAMSELLAYGTAVRLKCDEEELKKFAEAKTREVIERLTRRDHGEEDT